MWELWFKIVKNKDYFDIGVLALKNMAAALKFVLKALLETCREAPLEASFWSPIELSECSSELNVACSSRATRTTWLRNHIISR